MVSSFKLNKIIKILLLFTILLLISCYKAKSDEFSLRYINGPFNEEEYKEMRFEAENVVNFIKQNKKTFFSLNNTEINSMQTHLSPAKNHTDSFICKTCLTIFTKFHNFLERKYGLTFFTEMLSLLCTIGLSHNICHQAIDLYAPIVVDSLIEHYLDAEFICSKTHICKMSHFIELNPDDYARDLLKDKPPKALLKVDENAPVLKILHLTDLHTDLLYEEGSKGLCADPLCCRKSNGMAKSPEEAAGRWGFQGKCDIPLRTLDLFIETVVNDIKPDLIVWTGDNPPHNPWLKNGEEIYNITQVFIDILYNKYKYEGPVFSALGNHEEYVADQYNPLDIPEREKDFLSTMANMIKHWLSDEEYNQFVKHGYYTSKFKKTNLRIISLNCFLCDVMNFYLLRNPTDPDNQFRWMEKILRQSENDNEKVIIIGHIPPGDSTYLSQCSKRYNALVDRFSDTIMGQFFGHTHYDEFRIITQYFDQTSIAGLLLTSPSLTSYSWKNPSFRVYEMDSNTKLITDYKQYRLNLTEANLTPEIKPQFKISYSGKSAFNFTHLNDFVPFRVNIDRILKDNDWLNFIMDTFYAQGVEKLSYINNKQMGNYFTCRFKESVFDDYMKCTGYRTWDYTEYINKFIEYFTGKWFIKIFDEESNHHFLK